jgi:hypothetical protein
VCDCNYLAWLIATSSYVWLHKKKTWLCLCGWKATWLFGIWLRAWVVCDCKKLKCLIAKSAGLFLWLQQFGVRDCNQEKCAVAKKEPDFVCVVEKRNLVVWNMIASLGSKWLQKTKVCHYKNCWFISVTAKKRKRKTELVCDCNYLACMIATRNYVRLQKKKPDFVCVLAKLLGCLEYDCKRG